MRSSNRINSQAEDFEMTCHAFVIVSHAGSDLESEDMANIVEFPGGDVDKYSRRFQETLNAGAKILLFTGVRYERNGDDNLRAGAVLSDSASHSGEVPSPDTIDNPKSVG